MNYHSYMLKYYIRFGYKIKLAKFLNLDPRSPNATSDHTRPYQFNLLHYMTVLQSMKAVKHISTMTHFIQFMKFNLSVNQIICND